MRDRFLEHIGRECNRLIRISRGLLVLARSQSGEEPPRPDFVNVRSLLADVLDASPNDVAVDLRCPEDVAVFADRDLVEIALSNLVANAVRHTDGGTVSIAAENSSGRTVGIEIADSGGRGRSRDDLERLRRRFATGGGRDGGGFGLGISIASQALGAVGGTLDYSTENGSHRVRIELPAGHG
jgi:signal transduction histidine kinase